MTDRLAEQGAVQYAQNNPVSAGISRLGAAGRLQAAIADALSNGKASLTASRLGGLGRIYALASGAGPLFLFQNSEKGVWYDPSDLTAMFQDSAGTTAAVVGQPVGKILDKSGNGYHATQSTSTARPTLQVDANGKYYLKFDGVDDFLVTPSIDFSGTDKMSVFAGYYHDDTTANQCIVAVGAGTAGTVELRGFSGGTAVIQFYNISATAVASGPTIASLLAATPYVSSAIGDLGAPLTKINKNGSAFTSLVGPAGGGPYAANPIYIGARNGSLRLKGRLYSLIVRGALSDAAQIAAAESYVNSKTGAY